MTIRTPTLISLGALVAVAGCSLVTDFDSWHPIEDATAGTAAVAAAGRNAGVAGKAAGKVTGESGGVAGNTNLGGSGAMASTLGGNGMLAGAPGSGALGGNGASSSVSGAGTGAIGASGNSTPALGGAAGFGANVGVAANAGAVAASKGGNGANAGSGASAATGGLAAAAGTASGTVNTGGSMAGVAGASMTGGAGTSSGTSGAAGTTSVNEDCPGTGGPTMVKLPQGYCIDSTEVTRAQYTAWLNTTTAATINAQDVATCGWNTTFVPEPGCMADPRVCQGAGCENHPQVCIDWCDANAFCKSVGKRLCGKIGGGPVDWGQMKGSGVNQWYTACSSNGVNVYPYGNAYTGSACNGDDYQTPIHNDLTVPVASLSTCQAPVPFAGVFDLSGNVWEWEDSCGDSSAGSSAYCRLRGGGFANSNPQGDLACEASAATLRRNSVNPAFGIRCCSP